MPVIAAGPRVPKLSPERRAEIVRKLRAELDGETSLDGPVIFEIPLAWDDRFDAIVVWNNWAGVPGQDRIQTIEEAYGDRARSLSLAHGVTYEEALEQGQLPVRLRPRSNGTQVENRSALLSVGGFENRDGNIQLRYPTIGIAEVAKRQLEEKLPGSEWLIQSSESF